MCRATSRLSKRKKGHTIGNGFGEIPSGGRLTTHNFVQFVTNSQPIDRIKQKGDKHSTDCGVFMESVRFTYEQFYVTVVNTLALYQCNVASSQLKKKSAQRMNHGRQISGFTLTLSATSRT